MEQRSETLNIPQLPKSEQRCTEILSDTLRGYAGIRHAEFDLQNGRLRLDYDPRVLGDEHALSLVRRASAQAYARVLQCAFKSETTCSQCIAAMSSELAEHYQQLARLDPSLQAVFHGDTIEVTLPTHSRSNDLAQVEVRTTAPAVEIPTRAAFTRQRLEVALTIINGMMTLLAFLSQNFLGLPSLAITLMYVLAFVSGGYYGLVDGIAALRERRLDVNLLMILAALGAAIIGQPGEGAVLLFLFSLSNTLQTYAMDRSRKAIEKLIDLRPTVATVRRGSRLVTVPVDKLVIGDIVLVRPGERFPIDGQVITGTSTVDQSTITGESIPVNKNCGDPVFAGTLNGNGALEIRVTHLAQDTTLAKIIQLVEEAQSAKAQTQRMLDNFEQVYALLVLGGAFLLTIVPTFLLRENFYTTFYRAMTWLVVASPCALVISTPASILSAIANGARRGILFKGGVHLEQTANIQVVAFDKTGTLTTGTPTLTQILPFNGITADELLRLAASVEARSEHPLASAIVKSAEARHLKLLTATDFRAIPGQGVEASVEGKSVWIGNERLFDERRIPIPPSLRAQVASLEQAGQTVMLVNVEGEWLGLLAVADVLRPDAAQIVADLKKLGLSKVVMLTGDNERVAAAIAEKAGVDEYYAGLLPQDKVRILKVLKEKYGTTAMVGDGVNDAPALAAADVGIAMGGAGSDVALETADVVLMGDNLAHLPYAIGLARQTRKTVWQNLIFALSVIVLLVAAAFGAHLPLPLGVVGHEGSTVLVVLNGLRLLAYKR